MLRSGPRLVAYIKSFLSALVQVPGHPDHGAFYLVKGLLNAVNRYSWDAAFASPSSSGEGAAGGAGGGGGATSAEDEGATSLDALCAKTEIFTAVVPLLVAYAQRQIPRRLSRVESNDVLYGGNPAYLGELGTYLNTVVEMQLKLLNKVAAVDAVRHRELSLDAANALASESQS